MSRPTDYTPELGDVICSELAAGRSLTSICRADEMPSTVSVYAWLRKHEEFLNNYARAREDQADTLADEIVQIADTPVVGVKTKTTDDGIETIEGDMIEHRRLQVDARKWVAAKLKPKKYGDKTTTEHTGGVTVTWQPPTL